MIADLPGRAQAPPSLAAPPATIGPRATAEIVNGLSVDVEDYFHVSAFERSIATAHWPRLESRVVSNTTRLLDLFAEYDVRATFFVLGWVAERFPALVQSISSAGHEVASHGYAHRLIYSQSPREFRDDLRRARTAIEQAAGAPVIGYRAPSFSIVSRSLWALDVLVEEGYSFDSSIYPIAHDRYGIPSWERFAHLVARPGGSIWEIPGSTVRMGPVNMPIGGGGYFRLLPYACTRRGIRRVNTVEGRPVVFYVHPWEIDPGQPRLQGPLVSRLRHYGNLAKTEGRLRRLLSEFRFASLTSAVLDGAAAWA